MYLLNGAHRKYLTPPVKAILRRKRADQASRYIYQFTRNMLNDTMRIKLAKSIMWKIPCNKQPSFFN